LAVLLVVHHLSIFNMLFIEIEIPIDIVKAYAHDLLDTNFHK